MTITELCEFCTNNADAAGNEYREAVYRQFPAIVQRLKEIMEATYYVRDLCGDPLHRDKAEFDKWYDRLTDLLGTTEKEIPETRLE